MVEGTADIFESENPEKSSGSTESGMEVDFQSRGSDVTPADHLVAEDDLDKGETEFQEEDSAEKEPETTIETSKETDEFDDFDDDDFDDEFDDDFEEELDEDYDVNEDNFGDDFDSNDVEFPGDNSFDKPSSDAK